MQCPRREDVVKASFVVFRRDPKLQAQVPTCACMVRALEAYNTLQQHRTTSQYFCDCFAGGMSGHILLGFAWDPCATSAGIEPR